MNIAVTGIIASDKSPHTFNKKVYSLLLAKNVQK